MAGALELEKLVVRLVGDATGFDRVASGVGSSVDKLANKLAAVGAKLTATVTLPVIGALTFAGKSAIDFEESMAGVRKVITASEEEFKSLEESILSMTRTLPVSAVEIAAIAEAGGQLGLSIEELESKFIDLVAKTTVAFDTIAEDAANSVGRIRTRMGITLEQMQEFLDATNQLAAETSVAGKTSLTTAERIAGVGKSAGFTHLEIAALSNAFNTAAPNAESAATAFNAMIPKFLSASQGTARFKDGLKELGLTAEQTEDAFRAAPLEAFEMVVRRISESGDAGRRALVKMFEQGIDANVIASLSSNMGNLEKAIELVGDKSRFTGSMQREFEARAATTANQMQLLKNATMEVAITIGAVLLPPINKLIERVRPLVNQFATWAKANPELVQTLVKVSLAAAAVGPVLIGLSFGLNQVVSTGATIVKFALWFKGAAAGATAFVAAINPVTAIVIAAGAAVAGLVAWVVGVDGLVGAWGKAKSAAMDFWQFTKGFVANFQENIGILFKWIGDNWSALLQDVIVFSFKNQFLLIPKMAMVYFKTLFRLASATFGAIGGLIMRVFTIDFWKAVGKGIAKVTKWFAGLGSKIWEIIRKAFTGQTADIGGFLGTLFTDAGKAADDPLGAYKDILRDAGAEIGGIMSSQLSGALSVEGPQFNTTIESAKKTANETANELDKIAEAWDKIGAEAKQSKLAEAANETAKAAVQAEKALIQQQQAAESLTKSIDTLSNSLKVEIALLREEAAVGEMSDRQKQVFKQTLAGANREQQVHLSTLAKVADGLERQASMMQQGKQIIEDTLTPQEKFNKQQEELGKLFSIGALGKGMSGLNVYNRAIGKARKELEAAQKNSKVNVEFSVSGIDAVEKGTAEAASRIEKFFALKPGAGVENREAPVGVPAGPKPFSETGPEVIVGSKNSDENTSKMVDLLADILDITKKNAPKNKKKVELVDADIS